ncbi:mucin-binding protein, partial [Secundilactobacillus hailunensis]
MVGKNNQSKTIQANLKQHYKAYKVGRQWVFVSLASLSMGAALFLGASTSYAAEDPDTTPETESNQTSDKAASVTTAKTVTLPASTESAQSAVKDAVTATKPATTNVTAVNDQTSDKNASAVKPVATKQAVSAVKPSDQTGEQQPTATTHTDNVTQTSPQAGSKAGNNGLNDTTNHGEQVSVPKTDSKVATDSTSTGNKEVTTAPTAEVKTDTPANPETTAPAKAATSGKTTTTGTTPTQVDTVKVAQLEAQMKTLLVDPTAVDITQAQTIGSELYALTGQPQKIVAVADGEQPSVKLTTSTAKIGYGQSTDDVVVTAKMTVNAHDTVTITVPTNLDDLEWDPVKSVDDLPKGDGTTAYTKNADNTYTITNTFAEGGIFIQKIALVQLANNAGKTKLTADQVNTETKGDITATINGNPDSSAAITLTQESQPKLTISTPTRVKPKPTNVTDDNGKNVVDANGNPIVSADEIVPNTDYIYQFDVTDSIGIKDDSVAEKGIDSRLNTAGTTITIPVPTGFVLNSDLTDSLNEFPVGTTSVTQSTDGSQVIVTVPANTTVGQKGFYLAGKYTNKLTNTVQTLTANGKSTITQQIPNGQTLTATSQPLTEKMMAIGDGVVPAVGNVDVYGNSGTAPGKLLLNSSAADSPKYISSYGFGVDSATPITDAQITITVPDGIDATGVQVPVQAANQTSYLPGTTSYEYTITLADGTIQTGHVAAGGTIVKQGTTTSTISKVVLMPNYLAPGATTGAAGAQTENNAVHLLGKLAPKYSNGNPVKTNDSLNFKVNIQMKEDKYTRLDSTPETVSDAQGRVESYFSQTSHTPGKDSGYLALCINGQSHQTTDQIYEPILYFVLPAATSIKNIRGPLNAAKISYYTTDTGQTGVKFDYTGTGMSVNTGLDTNTYGIDLVNNADALPGDYPVYLYVTSPTTPLTGTGTLENQTKVASSYLTEIDGVADGKTIYVEPVDGKILVDGKPKLVDGKPVYAKHADTTFTDGDANAVCTPDYNGVRSWNITVAAGTVAQSMAQGNQGGMATNNGTSDVRDGDQLNFYTDIVNTSTAVNDASVAINLPKVGDGQGSTYNFQLTGPVTVPTTYTTAPGAGAGAPLTSTVLYSTKRYTKTGTGPDTTDYIPASATTGWTKDDWSKVQSVIVKVGNIATDTETGRIKLTGTTENFADQAGKIGYLQTTMYANGAKASVADKATSIAIKSTSTVTARMHYKDSTGADKYIPLNDLTQTLTDNKDMLNASDFPSLEDKLTATDAALVPVGYHLLKNPDNTLQLKIVNSDHGDYGPNEPNKTATFGDVSKYYFDGDIVQYELSNVEQVSAPVTYVDDDAPSSASKVVKTAPDISGNVGDTGTYTVDMTDLTPKGYVLSKGQDSTVSYTLAAYPSTKITIHLSHKTSTIDHTTPNRDNSDLNATINRTVNYVYGTDTDKPGTSASPVVVQKQDFTRTAVIDDVTNKVISHGAWTPTNGTGEGFDALPSPTIAGYTPDQSTVAKIETTALTATDQARNVTVTYNIDQKVLVHYIDVNGSPKTSGWTPNDGSEITKSVQTFIGAAGGGYTNKLAVPTNYTVVGQDAGATVGTYDNDAKTDQNYNVYVKHATKTITPTGDPTNTNLKVTVTRTINYVYGDDTVDHRKGDQAFSTVNQHQDYTRTGTVDAVTGKIISYGAWTPTTGTGEGLSEI